MIEFLLPLGLLGLLTLPIILLLHLQRERPRRRSVPSLLLWRRIESVQQHPEPRRLPLTLLLLLHLLVAVLLSAALARPALPGASPADPVHTIVLLDTSTSMAATDHAPSRFARAIGRVEQFAAARGPDDVLTVVRLSPTAEVVARMHGIAGEPAAPWRGLAPGGATLDLRAGLNLANGLLDPARVNRIIILTDATWLPEALGSLAEPAGAPITWEPLGATAANQAIVTFAARPLPAGGTDVIARVVNFGDVPVERTLRLLGHPTPPGVPRDQGDGSPASAPVVLADRPLSLQPNGEIVQHWVVRDDHPTLIEAELSGADALPADDRAILDLAGRRELSVALVGAESEAIARVLGALPNVVLDPGLPPETAALTIANGQLPEELPSGSVLLVNPPAGSPLLEPTGERGLPSPAVSDSLVRDLDLSSVNFGGASAPMPAWAEPVLLDSRRPERVLIWRATRGTTRVVALNFDLEQSNLPAKLAFPLLMARVFTELTPAGIPASVALGEPVVFPWDVAEFRVLGPDGAPLPIEERGDVRVVRPRAPGLHSVELGERIVASFAVQGGAPLESDLRPFQGASLPAISQAPLIAQPQTDPLRDLVPWLVAAALTILLIEQLYERIRR